MKEIGTLTDAEIDSVLKLLAKVAPRVARIHRQAAKSKLQGTDAWYMASYGVLTATKPQNHAGFIRVIAYAYSWLPRSTPVAQPTQKQVRRVLGLLNLANVPGPKQKTAKVRAKLLVATRQAIGVTGEGSNVTVSKVLHFSDPTIAPMFDRWVVEALRSMGFKKPEYIDYWNFVDRLIKRAPAHPKLGALTYRRVDELLFQMGKGTKRPTQPSSTKVSAAVVRRNAGSKLDNARAIYMRMRGQTSAVVRRALVVEARLTEKGANTYYYRFRREEKAAA